MKSAGLDHHLLQAEISLRYHSKVSLLSTESALKAVVILQWLPFWWK